MLIFADVPPLCPVAKGEKVMFVFILKVLDRDGPKSGLFWEVLKKCYHHPTLLKKHMVSPSKAPIGLAIIELLEPVENDAMIGVMPSVPANSTLTPAPTPPLALLSAIAMEAHYTLHPFPRTFDHMRIVSWGRQVSDVGFGTDVVTLTPIIVEAGHSGAYVDWILGALSFMLVP